MHHQRNARDLPTYHYTASKDRGDEVADCGRTRSVLHEYNTNKRACRVWRFVRRSARPGIEQLCATAKRVATRNFQSSNSPEGSAIFRLHQRSVPPLRDFVDTRA